MSELILSLSKDKPVRTYVFQSKNKDTGALSISPDLMTLFLNSLHFTVSDTSELTAELKKFGSYPFNKVCKLNALNTFLRCPGRLLNVLTFPAPIPDKEKKINLNFYFRSSLWCVKRFYEGL